MAPHKTKAAWSFLWWGIIIRRGKSQSLSSIYDRSYKSHIQRPAMKRTIGTRDVHVLVVLFDCFIPTCDTIADIVSVPFTQVPSETGTQCYLSVFRQFDYSPYYWSSDCWNWLHFSWSKRRIALLAQLLLPSWNVSEINKREKKEIALKYLREMLFTKPPYHWLSFYAVYIETRVTGSFVCAWYLYTVNAATTTTTTTRTRVLIYCWRIDPSAKSLAAPLAAEK